MKSYRSKNTLNTDKQFVFTCEVNAVPGFWFAFGLHDVEIGEFSDIDSVINANMKACVIIDNSNTLVKRDHYTDGSENFIKSTEEIENNKEFEFFNKKCIWLKPGVVDKTAYPGGKFYEKIIEFSNERDTYTNENGETYNAAPENKYTKNGNFPEINTADYPITSVFSFENENDKTKRYIDTNESFKIKLTITKNAIVSLYIDDDKISDFKFNYADKNNNYLYIISSDIDENQNILSNSAVSFVESRETS